MKRSLLILPVALIIQNLYAQDKIFTKDNKELTVKIVEQTDKLIKYKLTDYDDSPILSIKNKRIEKIEYKNGLIDILGNQNPRHYRPFGINAGMSYFLTEESGYFITNMDYFIIPQIDFQINIGLEFGGGKYFSIGSRLHLNSDYSETKFTPFTGLLVGAEYGDKFLQIPLGLNYIGKNGFNASFSLNELIFLNDPWESTFFELTVGWKFKI